MAHSHATKDSANKKRLMIAFWITVVFAVVELMGGLLTNSLALLSDSIHMITDAASLGLAWLAMILALRPADKARTYGFSRFQVLAAFTNGVALFVIVAWIFVEAVERFSQPVSVDAIPMLGVAVVGLVANLISFWVLHSGSDNINVRGAALHVMSDVLGALAAIIAAIVIWTWGWTAIDPILSVLVCLLVLKSAWKLIKESIHILLEGAPADFEEEKVKKALEALPQIRQIHHVHCWCLTPEKPIISLHVLAAENACSDDVIEAVNKILKEQFSLSHSTVQVEFLQDCPTKEDAGHTPNTEGEGISPSRA